MSAKTNFIEHTGNSCITTIKKNVSMIYLQLLGVHKTL